jgi:hypothetical protein
MWDALATVYRIFEMNACATRIDVAHASASSNQDTGKFAPVPRVRVMCETGQKFQICVQKIHFKSIKYILFTCILLLEGSNLKSMFIQDDESTGKDEGEVKSTPSI